MEQILLKNLNISSLSCKIIHCYLHKNPEYSTCRQCGKRVCKQCSKTFKSCDKFACDLDCYSCYKEKHTKCNILGCSLDSCMSLCNFCSRYFCNSHGDQCRKCGKDTCYSCSKMCIDRINEIFHNSIFYDKGPCDDHVHCHDCYSSFVIQCRDCKLFGCADFLYTYKCNFCQLNKCESCIYTKRRNGSTYDVLCRKCSTKRGIEGHPYIYKLYK